MKRSTELYLQLIHAYCVNIGVGKSDNFHSRTLTKPSLDLLYIGPLYSK